MGEVCLGWEEGVGLGVEEEEEEGGWGGPFLAASSSCCAWMAADVI